MISDGWTLKKYKYKNIPIYRFVTSDRINEDITNGISLATSFWYNQMPGYQNNNKSTHIILANSLVEKEYYENNTDFDVVFGNHNAFIDENQYVIQDCSKLYNMVINSTFRDYKRTYLARNIPNVVHIGYAYGNNTIIIPDYGHLANFKNNSRNMADYTSLNPKEIVSIYNSSHIGGIFSNIEGACFSSSEYLLCGLPVLSTRSSGGRDVFYNDYNSVICKDDVNSVKNSFDAMISNIDKYDKYKIREGHIEKMDEFRNNLTYYVKDLIEDKFKESVDFNELKSILKHYKPPFLI
jgi:glycosyltransferase involved in cell wall biosynthesis